MKGIRNSNHLFRYPRLYRRLGKRAIARCFLKIPLISMTIHYEIQM